MNSRALIPAVLVVALAACTSGDRDMVIDGMASICAYPPAAPSPMVFGLDTSTEELFFEPGEEVTFHAWYAGCLSSSCDSDRKASCDVVVTGDQIVVSSRLSFTSASHGICTDDCGLLATTCRSSGLEAGQYTVRHGFKAMVLTVGSTTAIPCIPGERAVTDG